MAASISLDGKVSIVTGGGRGIGKAIARRLVEAGARVVLASRKIDTLERAVGEFADLPGAALAVPCHVGRLAELEALVARTEDAFGPVDILVNNSTSRCSWSTAAR